MPQLSLSISQRVRDRQTDRQTDRQRERLADMTERLADMTEERGCRVDILLIEKGKHRISKGEMNVQIVRK